MNKQTNIMVYYPKYNFTITTLYDRNAHHFSQVSLNNGGVRFVLSPLALLKVIWV